MARMEGAFSGIMESRLPSASVRRNRFASLPFATLALAAACAGFLPCIGCKEAGQVEPKPGRALALETTAAPAGTLTALDRYVAAPDTNYSFRQITRSEE